ncbi:YqkE family protein [Paenisporosarcina cavernae]|uniref:DUF3886 domain-containing protein n=1 Tax=Paenisporosarcina cavernae TaxID=2320858 RepID=A0A385YTU0_9BACL|nr:YqkE family protein [Paenisporosarcina cavernae]AYC29337.1 DUF3886 domain-containing protein [Paenisporosarcina cavernae]
MNDQTLEQLQQLKIDLKNVEKEQEKARHEREAKERRMREKNKSFEELFNEHGMKGSKY